MTFISLRLLVIAYVFGHVRAVPQIVGQGPNLKLTVDSGGDIQVDDGTSGPTKSIIDTMAEIPKIYNAIGMLDNKTSTSITSVNMTSNSLFGTISAALDGATSRLDQLEAETRCLRDITTLQGIPINSHPVPDASMCNLTLGGTCNVMCKAGYRGSSSQNVAMGKVAVGFDNGTSITRAFDGVTSSDASRYVAGCTNRVCWIVVDLGTDYLISQINWYNGHATCLPGSRTCSFDALCKHYFSVWRGAYPSTSTSSSLYALGVNTVNWEQLVAITTPTTHGIENDAFTPTYARYVKFVVDNRRALDSCSGGTHLRIRELEVLTSATKAYTCTASGLVQADSTPLECDVLNGTLGF